MSVNLLTVPNQYTIYCKELIIDSEPGPTGPSAPGQRIVSAKQIIAENVPMVFLPAGSGNANPITQYSIRGVNQTVFPAAFPTIEYNFLTDNEGVTVINIVIPQLSIENYNTQPPDSGPYILQIPNIPEAVPTFPTSSPLGLVPGGQDDGRTSPLYNYCNGQLFISGQDRSIIQFQMIGTDPYFSAVVGYGFRLPVCGWIGDINFSYSLNP